MYVSARNTIGSALLFALMIVSPAAYSDFDPAGGDNTINNKDLLKVIELWRSNQYDENADPSSDAIIGWEDLLIFVQHFQTDAPAGPTPVPTDTPPVPTPVPTNTPTLPTATQPPVGDTFDFADYLPLDADSRWRFVGIPAEGGSVEDNFVWETHGAKGPLDNPALTTTVNLIKTTTDEPTDDRNGDEDFWFVDGNGDVYYHGFYNGQADTFSTVLGDATIIVQDIVVNPPLKLGGKGRKIGDVVHSEGTATVKVQSIFGLSSVTGDIDMDVNFDRFDPELAVPLGVFTNVLHLTISLTINVQGYENTIKDVELWFKKNVGFVKQDQDPDPNDAQVQGIETGQIGGVPIVAN